MDAAHSDELNARFRRTFARVGPVLREPNGSLESGALEILLAIARLAISRMWRAFGPRGPIHVDFVRNAAFNAHATEDDGFEFVTVLSGALNDTFNAAFLLLSDPEFLPELGEAGAERVNSRTELLLRPHVQIAERVLPRDPARVQAARDIALLTCVYIILHEVGHIAAGHPRFLTLSHRAWSYEEFVGRQRGAEYAALRLAFEYEADEFAAGTFFQLNRRIRSEAKLFEAARAIDPDKLWGICTSLFHVLTCTKSGSGMDSLNSTHPRPLFRAMFSVAAIGNSALCKALHPEFDRFEEGRMEVYSWCDRTGIRLWHERGADHLKLFKAEFAAVRETLARHRPLLDEAMLGRHPRGRSPPVA